MKSLSSHNSKKTSINIVMNVIVVISYLSRVTSAGLLARAGSNVPR